MTTQRTASTKCCPCDGGPSEPISCEGDLPCIRVSVTGLSPAPWAVAGPPFSVLGDCGTNCFARITGLGGCNRSWVIAPVGPGYEIFTACGVVANFEPCPCTTPDENCLGLSMVYTEVEVEVTLGCLPDLTLGVKGVTLWIRRPGSVDPIVLADFGVEDPVPFGTPIPNLSGASFVGGTPECPITLGDFAVGGTATVTIAADCTPLPTPNLVAVKCDDDAVTIPVDPATNTDGLGGILYDDEAYRLTGETTTDTPVSVTWTEQVCPPPVESRVATRCSGSGAPFIYDPASVPPGAVGLRDAGVNYTLTSTISGDPSAEPDEWRLAPCPAVLVCPPCSGTGDPINIDASLIPSGSLRARKGAVWYQITSTTTAASPVSVDEYSTDPCEGDYYEATRCRNTGIAAGAPEKVRYLPSTPGVGNGAVVLLTIDGDCIRVVRYRPTSVVDTVGLPYTGLHVGGTACSGGPDFITCEGDPEEAIPINSVCAFCGIPGFEYFDELCAIVCIESMAIKAPPGGEGKGFKALKPMVKKAVSDRPTYAIPDDYDPQAEERRLRSGGCCGQPSSPGESPG